MRPTKFGSKTECLGNAKYTSIDTNEDEGATGTFLESSQAELLESKGGCIQEHEKSLITALASFFEPYCENNTVFKLRFATVQSSN